MSRKERVRQKEKGLAVRIARALNSLWRRSVRLFADRFLSRVLETPREVRNVLHYLFFNVEKHGVRILGGFDPFTSGESFNGWKGGETMLADSSAGPFGRARTWLLRIGWRRHGLLSWHSAPHSTIR